MTRTSRIALLTALALVVALAGTVVATRSPVADDTSPRLADEHEEEAEGTPEQAALDRAADRLGVDVSRVRDLAAEHGFGTAVRLLAWEAEGATIEDVLARRADGQGWGAIAKELNLGLHPGLGSVMGNGGGHGRDHAPGQQRDDTDD